MTIVLKKNASPKEVEAAEKKLGIKKSKKTAFHKYFGSLKRGIEGLDYQKKVRSEWD